MEDEEIEVRKYAVLWCVRYEYIGRRYGNHKLAESDHYTAFIEDTSEINLSKAQDLYEELIKDEKVYSANICEILTSTDY